MKKVNRRSMEDYTKTSAINSMKLVRLVRSHELLYNSEAQGYTDKNYKETIWERINQALFPRYNSLDKKIQAIIRCNVRRRWKTLRNSITKEIKKSATIENYCRKKESPIISELEFLFPYIKSTYNAKNPDEHELTELEDHCQSIENDDLDEETFDEQVDLTEEMDIKPVIKMETSFHDFVTYADSPPDESIHSTNVVVNGAESEQQSNETGSMVSAWNNEYCAVAEYKEGEFTNSTVLCPEQICKDSSPTAATNCEQNISAKRLRTDLEDPAELQAKILQLLSNLERRERNDQRLDQEAHDEDRMFLLSLVSDLKRVPAAKKMLVKAEIATAIAKSIQQ